MDHLRPRTDFPRLPCEVTWSWCSDLLRSEDLGAKRTDSAWAFRVCASRTRRSPARSIPLQQQVEITPGLSISSIHSGGLAPREAPRAAAGARRSPVPGALRQAFPETLVSPGDPTSSLPQFQDGESPARLSAMQSDCWHLQLLRVSDYSPRFVW